jgi:hypothetical protein
VNTSRLRTDGPEKAERSHGWSTRGMIEQEHVEGGDEDGVGQVKEGLSVGGQTCDDIELLAWESHESGRFRWFGPQNHHGGGFPGLGLKTEGGARRGRAARRTHGITEEVMWRRSKDVNRSRPSDGKENKNRRKCPCVGDFHLIRLGANMEMAMVALGL